MITHPEFLDQLANEALYATASNLTEYIHREMGPLAGLDPHPVRHFNPNDIVGTVEPDNILVPITRLVSMTEASMYFLVFSTVFPIL